MLSGRREERRATCVNEELRQGGKVDRIWRRRGWTLCGNVVKGPFRRGREGRGEVELLYRGGKVNSGAKGQAGAVSLEGAGENAGVDGRVEK